MSHFYNHRGHFNLTSFWFCEAKSCMYKNCWESNLNSNFALLQRVLSREFSACPWPLDLFCFLQYSTPLAGFSRVKFLEALPSSMYTTSKQNLITTMQGTRTCSFTRRQAGIGRVGNLGSLRFNVVFWDLNTPLLDSATCRLLMTLRGLWFNNIQKVLGHCSPTWGRREEEGLRQGHIIKLDLAIPHPPPQIRCRQRTAHEPCGSLWRQTFRCLQLRRIWLNVPRGQDLNIHGQPYPLLGEISQQ